MQATDWSAPAVTFLARDERERLLLRFAELVFEQGFDLSRLSDLADLSDVPIETINRYWSTEAACVLEALDASSQQTFRLVAAAFMSSPGDCAVAAHRALGAMLHAMADSPAFVYLAVVVLPRLGSRSARHHKSMLDLFGQFLGPGFAAMGHTPPHPEIVSQIVTGGIFEVLRRHANEGRIRELPACLPAISHVCVATFFGRDEAERVSSIPVR